MNKKLLRKKLALMLANLKKKRKYYCEVEYIENTGSTADTDGAYIDTGYYPNNNTKVEFMASGISADSFTSSGGTWFFGGRQAFQQKMYGSYYTPNTQKLTFNYGTKTNETNVSSSLVYGDKKKFYLDSTGLYIDDVKRITPAAQSAFTSPVTMTLFALNNNGSVISFTKYKMHYCKIWDGNTLVRDFIPVLDWNMTPCMYDKVTGQLFYNQGTGNFTAGREIHPVDYLESTGTQYIDTGFNPTSKTRWEYDYRFNNTSSSYIGNGMFITSPSTQRFAIGLIGASFNMSYGADNVVSVPSDTDRHMFIIDANNMYWKIDNSTGTYSTQVTASLSRNIYFFARNGGSLYNAHSGKLYGSKIYDNGILVRDYLPAIDENGVGFMFDRVSHTIYDNAGTGAFKYPAREVEYLESTGTQYIDTEIIPTNTTEFELSAYYNNIVTYPTGENIFGMRYTSGTQWRYSISNYKSVNNYGYAAFGNNRKVQSTENGIHKYLFSYRNGVFSNGHNITQSIDISNDIPPVNPIPASWSLYLFAGNYIIESFKDETHGKVYYLKLWQNNHLVRDFIPCYKDGQAGFLNKVDGTFFANSGTGTFLTGKIIENEYE